MSSWNCLAKNYQSQYIHYSPKMNTLKKKLSVIVLVVKNRGTTDHFIIRMATKRAGPNTDYPIETV
jgi:hypothetical protein